MLKQDLRLILVHLAEYDDVVRIALHACQLVWDTIKIANDAHVLCLSHTEHRSMQAFQAISSSDVF